MRNNPAIIRVTLDVKPTRDGCDISRAIRWQLKTLLRTYGFRCLRATWDETTGNSPSSADGASVSGLQMTEGASAENQQMTEADEVKP